MLWARCSHLGGGGLPFEVEINCNFLALTFGNRQFEVTVIKLSNPKSQLEVTNVYRMKVVLKELGNCSKM